MKHTKDCQKNTTEENWLQRDVEKKETFGQVSFITTQNIPELFKK